MSSNTNVIFRIDILHTYYSDSCTTYFVRESVVEALESVRRSIKLPAWQRGVTPALSSLPFPWEITTHTPHPHTLYTTHTHIGRASVMFVLISPSPVTLQEICGLEEEAGNVNAMSAGRTSECINNRSTPQLRKRNTTTLSIIRACLLIRDKIYDWYACGGHSSLLCTKY